MNLFDTQNFLGSELEVVLKILDLEVDLAVVEPPPQQPLLVPSQRSSPSFATLAKTRQGQHTWHRKSRCQHCWLLLLLWLELLLLQLLLLELQLLELLLLQLLLNELLSGSWVPPGVEGKVLLGFDNTRGWVCTVFHGHRLLDIPGVEEDGLANLLGHLPALLLRNQLRDAGCHILALLLWRHAASLLWHLNCRFHNFVVALLFPLNHTTMVLGADLSLDLVTAGHWKRGSPTERHLMRGIALGLVKVPANNLRLWSLRL